MSNHPLKLLFTAGLNIAHLREITGADELAIAGKGLADALGLVDRLWLKGQEVEVGAKALASADRDRILAEVYASIYGDKISASLECPQCSEEFDLSFSLAQYVDHRHSLTPPQNWTRKPGELSNENGLKIRLPNGADELAIEGLDEAEAAEALLKRCLMEGDPQDASELDEVFWDTAMPMLQSELDAQCFECGHISQVQFDVQNYLLQALLQEREQLTYEVHRLAKAYGWSLSEILGLSRQVRKQYVRMVEMEMSPGIML